MNAGQVNDWENPQVVGRNKEPGHATLIPTSNEFDAQLQSVGQTALTPIVRRALGSETIEVAHWDYQQIHGGIGGGIGGTAIYRFAGQGRDQEKAVLWSVILKVLWAQADSDESDCYYWRHEADAYQSGWLDDLLDNFDLFAYVWWQPERCWRLADARAGRSGHARAHATGVLPALGGDIAGRRNGILKR